MKKYSPLCIGHDAALGEVAQPVTGALRVGTVAPAAAFKQRHSFFNRVKPAHAQVPAVQPVYPCARIPLVRDQGDTDLRDGNRQRVVDETCAITCLDTAIEKQPAMNTFPFAP